MTHSDFSEAVITTDTHGNITFLNSLAQSLTGWTQDEAAGRPLESVFKIIDDSHKSAESPAGRVLREGRAVGLTNHTLLVAKDGTERPIHNSAAPLRDGTGDVSGVILIFHDITESRRMEVALQDSELRYRRLFQTAKDGILILDARTGKVLDANPFMSGLLGYELNEFLGKELWQIGMFRDMVASRAAFRELQQSGYIRYDNLPLQTKAGKEIEVEFVSNVYTVDQRQVAQCNIRDISDRYRLQRQAQEQATQLADLHRRKDEFMAMLSHELRNPLAPILNAVHLLRLQTDENLIQQQARNIIERQTGQLARLVDDLLEISRIATGRIRLNQERLDMRSMAERAVETVRPLMDRKRHELSVSLPPEPVWLYADPARMEQVVVNLLNNAAKYTDEGGHVWLTVRQEGDEMVLRVRDTGIGIDHALLPRIFDLFTQADRSLNRSEGGLGIGLAVVHKLVDLHRGTVEAESKGIGQGSEFIVRAPVLLSPVPSPAPPAAAGPGAPSNPASRVLVVDDNVDAAESMALFLKMSGRDVQTAYSGPAALEAAAAFLPNVVLLDIGLPGLNGYEVARRLRANSQLKDVWLLAMTGFGSETDVQLAKEAGFDRHLVKPVDPVKVQELLTTMMTTPRSK